MNQLDKRLRALTPGVLATLRRGIEKESLRVQPDGMLADTPHPQGLGSALTHAHITTDFSESQVELITGVHDSVDACLAELTELHQVVYREIGDELLWCASMPCKLPDEDKIPIGQYGVRQHRPDEIGLSRGLGPSIRPADADHFRHPLQLLAAGGGLVDAQGIRSGQRSRGRVPGPGLLRTDSQLPAPFVAAARSCTGRRRPCAARFSAGIRMRWPTGILGPS